jgi:hypothetical protein
MSNKIETLKDVRDYLSCIENIHDGGCAYAALFMFLWVKKHEPESKVHMVYMYHDHNKWKYENNRESLKGQSDEFESCSHACIKYNGVYMDCMENNANAFYYKLLPIRNPRFILETLKFKDKWNDEFQRKNISKIQKKAWNIFGRDLK